MRLSVLSWMRLCALFVVTLSAALLTHYVDPAGSSFCGGASGCEAVRRSPFAYFGVTWLNLPLLGLASYGALLLVSLLRRTERTVMMLKVAAAAGATGAVGLILVQAWLIQRYCMLCLGVDLGALGVAFAAAKLRAKREAPESLSPLAWCGLLVLAVLAAPAYHWVKPLPPVPGVVQAYYKEGQVNVVEFADFECPYCARLHPMLRAMNAKYPEKLNFVRLHAPSPRHPHAEVAAFAAICAEKQGQGEKMADQLFEVELSATTGREVAEELRMDLSAFDKCIQASQTWERVQADLVTFAAAGLQGLPSTYIGPFMFLGVPSERDLKKAYHQAATRRQPWSGLKAWQFLLLLGTSVVAVVWAGRRGPG